MALLSSLNSFLRNLVRENKILASVVLYEIIMTLVVMTTSLDLRIPCLFTLCFGMKCYGCGMSDAFLELIKFNFTEAFRLNFLVYPFVIGATYYLFIEFKKFRNTLQ